MPSCAAQRVGLDACSAVSRRAGMARPSCTARSPCCAHAVVLRRATTTVHEDIEDVGRPSHGALRWRCVSAQGAPPPPSPPPPSPPPPTPRPELRLSTLASATTSHGAPVCTRVLPQVLKVCCSAQAQAAGKRALLFFYEGDEACADELAALDVAGGELFLRGCDVHAVRSGR